MAHLRPRTNLIGAVTRVRNALSYATHTFFQASWFHVRLSQPTAAQPEAERGDWSLGGAKRFMSCDMLNA